MDACAVCGALLPETARFCATCGSSAQTKPDERERKLATVIFADLVGSTELGGSQDPERTRALLDRFYDAMAGQIDAAGGTVEKFAGDAVMAAFGAPASLEDHAERALHAALAMQRRLREIFGAALELRIGVNTGEVVVGKEAPAILKPETYLEPFALRALGFARNDDALIGQAIERFEAMGLDWHAAETRKLLARA